MTFFKKWKCPRTFSFSWFLIIFKSDKSSSTTIKVSTKINKSVAIFNLVVLKYCAKFDYSKIITFNLHFNFHFLLSRSGSFLLNRKWKKIGNYSGNWKWKFTTSYQNLNTFEQLSLQLLTNMKTWEFHKF